MAQVQKPKVPSEQPVYERESQATAPMNSIHLAFRNAEIVPPKGGSAGQLSTGESASPDGNRRVHQDLGNVSLPLVQPITPLGHHGGQYFIISPSGEFRRLSAETLEAGRVVRSLFLGSSPETEDWCRAMFPARENGWCHRKAGLWIIEQCNAKGVFDLNRADLRSIGVWRDDTGQAIAHCGDRLALPNGQSLALTEHHAKYVMVGAGPITVPDITPMPLDTVRNLLHDMRRLWGWNRSIDADIWLGWAAAACLGGFPDWRTHLYVHGSRGSGKSKLIELAACLIGDLAGEVVNDATEAGVRQSRNDQARPLLIDEFEPDDNPRNARRQDNMLALFRRMSGGAGGRVARGGSDHLPVSFRTLGAAYVTSINHIQLEPQDRSRFVLLELKPLPGGQDPARAASDLEDIFRTCRAISAQFRGRLLAQSSRWQRTLTAISAMARSMGADARQAETAATVLAGLDLALFDSDIDDLRLEDLRDPLEALLSDSGEAEEVSEGRDALDHLLSASLSLDHGFKRTVGEIVFSEIDDEPITGVDDRIGVLRRHGIYFDKGKQRLALRSGRSTPIAKLYDDTKWRNGAHVSALKKLDGVVHPSNAVRVTTNDQHRVVWVPFACLRR